MQPFTPEQVAETVKELTDNPPAPFDLSRKTPRLLDQVSVR